MKEIKTIEPVQEINNKFENEKVRVAVYVRVSTKSIEQEGSFEMQKDAYINMIKKIPNWKCSMALCYKRRERKKCLSRVTNT